MALTFARYAAPGHVRARSASSRSSRSPPLNYRGVQQAGPGHAGDRRAHAGDARGRRRGGRSRAAAASTANRAAPVGPAGCCSPPGCCSSRSPGTRGSPRWARRWSTRAARSPGRSRWRSASSSCLPRGRVARCSPSARTALAATAAPLRAVVEAGSWAALSPVVQVGAAVASLGALLALVLGVSRTAFAMARDRGCRRSSQPSTRGTACRTGRSSPSRPSSSCSSRPWTCAARSGSRRSACSPTTP